MKSLIPARLWAVPAKNSKQSADESTSLRDSQIGFPQSKVSSFANCSSESWNDNIAAKIHRRK